MAGVVPRSSSVHVRPSISMKPWQIMGAQSSEGTMASVELLQVFKGHQDGMRGGTLL